MGQLTTASQVVLEMGWESVLLRADPLSGGFFVFPVLHSRPSYSLRVLMVLGCFLFVCLVCLFVCFDQLLN